MDKENVSSSILKYSRELYINADSTDVFDQQQRSMKAEQLNQKQQLFHIMRKPTLFVKEKQIYIWQWLS